MVISELSSPVSSCFMSNLAICFFILLLFPSFFFGRGTGIGKEGCMKHFAAWFYTHPALRDTKQYAQKSVCGTAATGIGQTRPARTHRCAFALPGMPQRKAGDHLALSSARTTPDECFFLKPAD